ncbi:mono-functional DNA-alkylating methyl methanesulfonate N-term-domain-containing protein [Xylaria flabelliformis]|nr:mono-functional DNA-alkylating methyl methanesulfonate N-term-domain-containing protein [Xylaria flabelliformis]
MASLQTQVLVNNEWVTQTITAEELFKSRVKPTTPAPPKPPNYGVLTKTVVKSPIVRWILPVQLRSSRFNDVALVGDQAVQICEPSPDTQLQPIAKVEFGSKIKNCSVLGTHDYLRRTREDIHANYHRGDDADTTSYDPSTSSTQHGDIEPIQQVLVLVLFTGELVFLIMNLTSAGDWKFVPSHFPIFGNINKNGEYVGHGDGDETLIDPGFHMTISPDGGYLALACAENLFIVYQLNSIAELRLQHAKGQSLQPIRSIRARAVKGIIHKLEFLHPGSGNAFDVVLLVIIAQPGVLRLAIYDWDTRQSLRDVLCEEKPGHRLDETAGIPLLIIPLTFGCQFLIITERSMAICSDVLSGPPVFAPFVLAHRDKTEWHHGTGNPLWTAWARPLREESYYSETDVIYLAREDGWINNLEISSDFDIEVSNYYGPLECNIDLGFASLSTLHGEVLIAGGDYGPGAIWHVYPRANPQRFGSLPNWSPMVDLVLTKDASGYAQPDFKRLPPPIEKPQSQTLPPEKIYVCSGRDKSGAIVEMRHGIEAKIGLDLLYSSPIKKCWVIPSFESTPEAGFFILLALPETSALLHISHNLSEVSEKDQHTVNFDLLSTTLAVHVSKDLVIQITAAHATIISPTSCYQHSISDMVEDPSATITDSAITGETLALSVYSQSVFKIMVFTFDKTRFVLAHTIDKLDGDITALSLNTLSIGACVLASIWYKDLSTLVIVPLNSLHPEGQTLSNTQRETITLSMPGDVDSTGIHAVTSIVCLEDDKIVMGKRDGDVLTIRLMNDHQGGRRLAVTRTNHFGISPSNVFTGMIFDTGPSTLVCNDAGLAIMKEIGEQPNAGCHEEISRIWLTDANEPHSPSPTINSVARLHQIPEYGASTWAMVAGSHILITELQSHPAPVPRYMPIEGTPLKVLYSERLKALVTVVKKNGIPSLHFFDPVTGVDLSRPVRKVSDQDDEQQEDVDYIAHLDNPNIKFASLMSWRYKNKYEWFVILARIGESHGRLLVVSAMQPEVATSEGSRQIRFWTQFHRKIKDGLPRFGTTDDNGLFLNFGKTLEYHVIEDKKFKTAMKYDLPSPATSLEVIGGHLHVLTSHHSLLILDYKSDAALRSQRMITLHMDEIARNGLHSIDAGSFVSAKNPQKFVLVSDPMCAVYGLWSPGQNTGASKFQLVFMANLTVSIRKFVTGYTRPRWARREPRNGHKPTSSDRRDILGLAIDGSLTHFSILEEDTWRLLRYLQDLAMVAASKDPCLVPGGHESAGSLQLAPNSLAKTKMHVDGDILQHCFEKGILERIVSTPQDIARLQELVLPLGLDLGATNSQMRDETSRVFEHAYGILEYHLSPAL